MTGDRPRLFDRAFGWTVLDINGCVDQFSSYLEGQGVEPDDDDLDGALAVVDGHGPAD